MIRSIFTSRLFIGMLVISIAGLAALAISGYFLIPDVDAQLPLPLTFELTISEPIDEATIFLHDNVNVQVDTHTSFVPASVDSEGLGNDQYEFWVDETLMSTMVGEAPALDKGRYAYTLWIPWEATAPGWHTLVVRGKNKYWNAVSNVVHIKVLDLAAVSDVEPYTPQGTESLSDIATKFGLSPIFLAATNPNILDINDPVPADKPFYIPKAFEPIDQNPPQVIEGKEGDFRTGSPPPEINKFLAWVDINFTSADPLKVGIPSAPTLFRFKEGCGVTLYIRDNSNNELGFYIYRLDPGSTSFKRLAAFGPHSGDKFIEYKDMNLFGKFQYYAAAFNAFGESSDSFMSVDFFDKGCIEPRAVDYKLNQVKFSSDVPADKTYCYYSLQEGDWSRMPADPQAFFQPLNNTFNLSDQLSTVRLSSSSSLSVECWGWSGGGLIFLGTGKAAADPSQPQLQVKGDQFAITGDLSAVGSYPDPVLMDIKKKIVIRPPEDLEATNNIDVCISHFPPAMQGFLGPLFCKSSLETGSIVLVWEWFPPIFPIDDPEIIETREIDGYFVYKYYPGGTPVLVKTINDPKQTVLIQPAESSLKLPIYFVRAFRNIYTSGDSNHYPLIAGGSAAFITVSLTPVPHAENEISYFSDYAQLGRDDCGRGGAYPGEISPRDGLKSDEIVVGYEHFSEQGCVELFDQYFRSSILFDLKPVAGPVSKAELSYVQGKTVSDAPGTYSTGGQSCADSLNIMTTISTAGIEAFDPYRALSKYGYSGLTHSVNVTEAVRDWVSGLSLNQGFVFTGRDESFPEENDVCWSRYGNFVLYVTYFDLSK